MGRIAVSDGGRVVWNLLSVTGGRNALLPEEPRMIRHLLHVDFQPGRGLQEQASFFLSLVSLLRSFR